MESSPKSPAVRPLSSSFSIKSILNLPDDEPARVGLNRSTHSSSITLQPSSHGAVCPDNLHAPFPCNQMFCGPQLLPFGRGNDFSRQTAAVAGKQALRGVDVK